MRKRARQPETFGKPGAAHKRMLEFIDQLTRATRQVDEERGGRLGWLVKFAREDPATWLPADREAHRYRLAAFTYGMPSSPQDYVRSPGDWVDGALFEAKDVEVLHREVRQMLRTLVASTHEVEIPAVGVRTTLSRVGSPQGNRNVFRLSHGGPLRTMLWQTLARLVAATDRLAACANCGEPFLALRKSKFCSPKCTQRWWDREKGRAKKAGLGGTR
jgi:hypothetical protein